MDLGILTFFIFCVMCGLEKLGLESFKDWGGRGCHKFVPVLAGDKSKIAPRGDLCDQPPGCIS